ncbi:DUF1302 family protein [Pseudomonas sp. SBB6]|uniref:DUF1302 family protein n=1 Tax=Pseudomonas sp. SBB6 TaxID=2962032 RepID=UPI0020B78F1B|nr:DUF1302 family protein [Pseudomonas sp. SBB6]MCP3751629.1 hypothetical protein [Pseudomonas sp. SBB6]
MLKALTFALSALPVTVLAGTLDIDSKISYQTAENLAMKKLSKSELRFYNALSYQTDNDARFFLSTRLRWNMSGQLEPGAPDQTALSPISDGREIYDNYPFQFELREAYFRDTLGEEGTLTLGKQQVVWGQADGVTVLDIVNPMNYREFILEDPEEARIPLWMANVVVPVGPFDMQVLWIPDQTYTDFPNYNEGEFAIRSRRLIPQASAGLAIPVNRRKAERPDRPFKDSDIGLALTTSVESWDFSLNYMYHYNDAPFFETRLALENMSPVIVVRERYERTHTFGASASTSINDFVLRSELAHATHRSVIDYDPTSVNGRFRTNETSYVVGLDYYGVTESVLSAQFYQSILGDHNDDLPRDKVDNIMTFLYRKDLMHQRDTFEAQWLTNINDGDGLVRLEYASKFSKSFKGTIGLDIFHGDPNGLFGQFHDNDRLQLKLDYFF